MRILIAYFLLMPLLLAGCASNNGAYQEKRYREYDFGIDLSGDEVNELFLAYNCRETGCNYRIKTSDNSKEIGDVFLKDCYVKITPGYNEYYDISAFVYEGPAAGALIVYSYKDGYYAIGKETKMSLESDEDFKGICGDKIEPRD